MAVDSASERRTQTNVNYERKPNRQDRSHSHPEGMPDNSSTFQRWVPGRNGTLVPKGRLSRPPLGPARPHKKLCRHTFSPHHPPPSPCAQIACLQYITIIQSHKLCRSIFPFRSSFGPDARPYSYRRFPNLLVALRQERRFPNRRGLGSSKAQNIFNVRQNRVLRYGRPEVCVRRRQ